ncbi:MAG TPA: sulfotransferase domain-containing protein [Thermohalobaculum sp.]|nr:sulfotransferase domain-containing protein [Thermohalobaculum sp.]
MARRNLLWLASYPKSGNTWTRVLLANYLFNAKTPVPINQVHRLGIGDSVAETYRRAAGGRFDPADIKATLALRPKVLRGIAANGADVNFVKTHARRGRLAGVELVPPELTRAAVYILRDPHDMVLSYARHYGGTPEDAVAAMAREDHIVLGEAGSAVQFVGNWSRHVESWTRTRRFPVVVIRYEDLKADPAAGFARILELVGVPVEAERLERAIRFSSFEEMQRQEAAHGFIERSARAERFFARGESGRGRRELSPELARRIAEAHGPVMQEHGYL